MITSSRCFGICLTLFAGLAVHSYGQTITVSPNPIPKNTCQINPPDPVTFNNGALTASETITVVSKVNTKFALSSDSAWLQVPSSGSTGTPITMQYKASTVRKGGQFAIVTIQPQNGGAPTRFSVELDCSPTPPVSFDPGTPEPLTLTAPSGQTVPATSVKVVGLDSPTQPPPTYTFGESVRYMDPSASGWITTSGATSVIAGNSTSIQIAADARKLSQGSYTAFVDVADSKGVDRDTLAVILNVSAPVASLVFPPGSTALSFTTAVGGAVSTQTINVSSSTGTQLNYSTSAITNDGAPWLQVNPASGNTSQNPQISVSANPAGLQPGSYSGTVTITGGSGSATQVHVALQVQQVPTISVPASLSFSGAPGAFLPQQSLSISGGNGLAFVSAIQPNSAGSWLTVSPVSGTLPAALAVNVFTAGLSAGVYNAQILINEPTAATSQTTNVTLTISQSITLSVTPALQFAYRVNDPAPPSQTINVSSAGGPVGFTATLDPSATWLSAQSPLSGTTPASIQLAVNPAGLAVNTYRANVTFASTQAGNSPQQTSVTLTVSAAASGGFQILSQAPLPNGYLGRVYYQPLDASGGAAPYTWGVSGAAPPGLTIDPATGILAGVPQAPGDYSFHLVALDSGGRVADQIVPLHIGTPGDGSTAVIESRKGLICGFQGWFYSQPLEVSGRTGGSWQLLSGNLSAFNLQIDSNGLITGTPGNSGTVRFHMRYTAGNPPPEQDFVIEIYPTNVGPLTIVTDRLDVAVVGPQYVQRLDALGGTPPYQWSIAPSSPPVPAWLSLTNATMSGFPDGSGAYPVTLQVQDAAGNAGQQSMLLLVTATQTTIVTPTRLGLLPLGSIAYTPGDPGSQWVDGMAGGGITLSNWTLVAGALPSGLYVDPSGFIGGSTASAGVYAFTLQGSLGDGTAVSKGFRLVVPTQVNLPIPILPSVAAGQSYPSFSLSASGSVAPYIWELDDANGNVNDAVVPGLTIDPVAGMLAGTPSASGAYSVTIKLSTNLSYWDKAFITVVPAVIVIQ